MGREAIEGPLYRSVCPSHHGYYSVQDKAIWSYVGDVIKLEFELHNSVLQTRRQKEVSRDESFHSSVGTLD